MSDGKENTNSKKNIGKVVTEKVLSRTGNSLPSPSALPFDIMYRGYFPLWRKLRDWEWYSNSNIKAVFLELLLLANHKKKPFQGHIISPGQCVTGRKRLSATLGLSEQQVRTALKRLKATNEITIKSCNRYSIITLNNYHKYTVLTSERTNKEPTDNQQITTTYNDKNVKNDNNIRSKRDRPTLPQCKEYFLSLRASLLEAEKYFDYYTSNGWKVGKNSMKDWKAAARNWIGRIKDKTGKKLNVDIWYEKRKKMEADNENKARGLLPHNTSDRGDIPK